MIEKKKKSLIATGFCLFVVSILITTTIVSVSLSIGQLLLSNAGSSGIFQQLLSFFMDPVSLSLYHVQSLVESVQLLLQLLVLCR